DNDPAPVGSNNEVAGNMEDQCADLQPEGDGEGDDDTGGSGDDGAGGGTGGSDDGGFTGDSGGGSFGILTLAMLLTWTLGLLGRRRRRGPPAGLLASTIRPQPRFLTHRAVMRTSKESDHVEAIRREVRRRNRGR